MEKHQDTYERKTSMEQSRKYRKRKREMQKRLIKTFLILLVMTGIGIAAVVLVPKNDKGKVPGQGESLQTSAKPVDKEGDSKDLEQKEPDIQQSEEKSDNAGEVRTAVITQADLLAAGYDYDSAIETVKSFDG